MSLLLPGEENAFEHGFNSIRDSLFCSQNVKSPRNPGGFFGLHLFVESKRDSRSKVQLCSVGFGSGCGRTRHGTGEGWFGNGKDAGEFEILKDVLNGDFKVQIVFT